MRKKFLSAFLLGALALGATSTIVSCKDYDGDISELRQDINSLDATLKSELQSIKDQLAAQKSELETKIASAQATLQTAINQKADKEVVDDLAKNVLNLQTSLSAVDTRLDAVEEAIVAINEKLKDLDKKADKSEVESVKTELELMVKALEGALGGKIDGLTTTISDLQQALEGKDDELKGMIDDVNNRISGILGENGDIEAINNKLAAFFGEDSNPATLAEIMNMINTLQLQAGTFDAAKGDFETRISTLEGMLGNYQDVVDDLNAAKDTLVALRRDVQTCFNAIQVNANNIKANSYAITTLNIRVTNVVDTLNKTINTKIAQAKEAISQDINVVQNLFSKRLTSILFAPSTYVDGVEAINFASLGYKVWGDNLLANAAPADAAENRIDDGTTTAVYYLNPSGVDESSIEGGIKGLSFISNTASFVTRGAAEPILTVKEGTIENGKLTLKLTKNNVALENSNKNFTIVSLKAPLAEKVLSEEEKENGGVNVYSDWARLTETTSTPLIYNKKNVVDGVAVGKTEAENRFYNFGTIYTQYDAEKNNSNEALHFPDYGPYYRNQLNMVCCAYNETLDLKEYVTVCDEDGNEIDAEAFGLKFKFNLTQCYNVSNTGTTNDATNQQDFASITADGILSAKTTDSDEGNRAAIGKTPVVQVVLYDANNENAVVDVRYILVKWTEKATETIVCETVEEKDPSRWECGGYYLATIGESVLNKIASRLNLESSKELRGLYSVDYRLTDAYEGDEINTIGTVEDKYNGGITGQADNIVARFDAIALDKSLYEGGKAELTGYVTLTNRYDNQKVVIPVHLTVEFYSSRQLKASEEYVKDMDLWADGGASIVVKPTVEGDYANATSCNIKYRLLNAYRKGAATANTVADLVTCDERDNISTKLAIDPTSLEQGWTLNDAGTQIKIGNVVAATLNTNTGLVQLKENNGEPTAAALKLVGKTIRVKLISTICDYTVVIDEFNVTFGEPLSKAWNGEIEMEAGREVSKDVDWAKMLTLKEVYGEKRLVIGYEDNAAVWNKDLMAWYVTGAPVVDVANATVNGYPIAEWTESGNRIYFLTYGDNDGNAKFTFVNNSKNNRALTIKVPVTVSSKWHIWKETITITVPKAE